ncbi:Na+/H+ antiporter NhaC family protein [Parendozoicomonas sp. Alg238-R29]|uniref:Na+/H+ antiporter family protein n=1 Tax=Parendozoicomonas sp. Alg238-R29 TaxID=2993446 RepID=UPI00248EB15D|nr:Na+/H+ antiporter NhaC family protein [Parendozoicomonas sp. Alg238-R29]
MNAVVIAVLVMLAMSLARMNVVLALLVGAITGGIAGGMPIADTLASFSGGLANGASIALSYALLGAFAMAISKSGVPVALAGRIITFIHSRRSGHRSAGIALMLCLILMAIASQNIIPIHIAFIPILVPPLLGLLSKLQLDRRAIACCLTFGLTATYMLLPIGFGNIYLIEILAGNLRTNGLEISNSAIPSAMMIPVSGMFLGLLIAVFWTYRKPRNYRTEDENVSANDVPENISATKVAGIVLGILAALMVQLGSGSMAMGALAGCITMLVFKVMKWQEADNTFIDGMKMMSYCGFIMISAAGFAEVMRATGDINTLVSSISGLFVGQQALGILMMLVVGLLITLGIGSSFSTVPIIAALYVPLGMEMGLSPLAIAALVGTAGALGDAGSPASDSTIGPTAGLNADGQHDHIRDSVLPTFIHFNIPLVLFGWLAVMVL